MSALSVEPPYPAFADADGQPLEDGYIWIGTANLNPITNPIAAYWDAALTIAAVQPIRTLGGYPSNSGTPARIYVNSDYSIQVQNRNGSVVYSAPAATERYGGIINASDVVYDPAGTGAVATTVQAKLRESVSVFDFMTAAQVADVEANTASIDVTAAIQAAENACSTSGQALWFPAGTYRCNSGLTKKAVNWWGANQKKTVLDYRGNSVFINATGTDPNRVMCSMSDIGFSGVNSGTASVGITLGFNQRSTPLIRCNFIGFGRYGLYFNDQNWIVNIFDIVVESCGNRFNDGAGIYKDPAVNSGTWNAISFYNINLEGCGNASSQAGGVNIQTTNANRGLYFYSACIEGNVGTAEILITNMVDCQFFNLYMEVVNGSASFAMELDGVNGGITGGYIRGENPAANLVGIRVRPVTAGLIPNELQLDKVTIAGFGNSINAESAKIMTGQVSGDRIFVSSSPSTQWSGNYAPMASVVKNAVQSVASGVFTKVTFQTEIYDVTGGYTGSTYYPVTLGTYQIDACISWEAATDQDELILSIYKRGAAYKSIILRASGTGNQDISISCQIEIDLVDDSIELFCRQTSGSAQNISASTNNTWFMASFIGRTV